MDLFRVRSPRRCAFAAMNLNGEFERAGAVAFEWLDCADEYGYPRRELLEDAEVEQPRLVDEGGDDGCRADARQLTARPGACSQLSVLHRTRVPTFAQLGAFVYVLRKCLSSPS